MNRNPLSKSNSGCPCLAHTAGKMPPCSPTTRSGLSAGKKQPAPYQSRYQSRKGPTSSSLHDSGRTNTSSCCFSSPHSPRISQLRLLCIARGRGFGCLGCMCLDWRRKRSYLQPARCPESQSTSCSNQTRLCSASLDGLGEPKLPGDTTHQQNPTDSPSGISCSASLKS